ncbi:MAG: 50S ribosomal protein L19e [Nanoarchaeota archaeon]
MDLSKKKALAARTLGVGEGRIRFNSNSLNEIKEAITKQDIRDLVSSKAILIKETKGKKAKKPRKRARAGSIRMRPNNRKREYIILTRKLRAYLSEIRKQGKIDDGEFLKLRKGIRSKIFKNKSHLKENIQLMQKEKK